MNIILFSKDPSVLDHWQNKFTHIDSSRFNEIIQCSSFKQLGNAIADENHILLFHLASGDEAEKICYQFIFKYQQQHKMVVFVNSPNAAQGLRIFRSGAHGYSNTFLDEKKLSVAIDVIEQGKIWIGAATLKTLLNDCDFGSKNNQEKQVNNIDNSTEENPNSLLGALFKGIKKLFG
ncbi:MAG: hypothetical protein QM504_14990 [Pseudomonadota bacterium]